MTDSNTPSSRLNALTVYNPAEKSRVDLIDEFVVRRQVFELIFKGIKDSSLSTPPGHYLVIAQRGAGKTTLMYRLKYAIDDDIELRQHLIPVNLGEEQYHINSLSDLWQSVTEILEDYHGFPKIIYRKNINDGLSSEDTSGKLLGDAVVRKKKRIVLFIENFGDLLKKMNDSEISIFENVLRSSNWLQLVAGSPISLESAFEGSNITFGMFKTVELKGLSNEETKMLLLKLAEINGALEKIEKIIKENPQRIEILRRLTGGVIRTMVLLFKIFLERTEDGKSIRDLQLILDSVTPLYKHRMDDLPHQQQKIVDVVAKNWDAISVKDITMKSKIPSKVVSAQLRQLEKNYVITRLATDSKNNLYQLTERFLNIWYLMRYGRKDDKKRVTWLVRFFDAWCSKQELEERVKRHIENLGSKDYDANSALFMGETYVACKALDMATKEKLIETTANLYPNEFDAKRFNLDDDIVKEALRLLKEQRPEEAIAKLESLQNITESNYKAVARIAWEAHDFDLLISTLKTADEKGFASKFDLHFIGSVLERELESYDEAFLFYQKAVDSGNKNAKVSIAKLFYKCLNKTNEAEEMLLTLIQEEPKNSEYYHELGHLYGYHKVNQEKAIYNFKKSIELGRTGSNYCLGVLYHYELKDFEQAKQYYSLEPTGKNYNLGKLYFDFAQEDEVTIDYFEKAIRDQYLNAYYYLGRIYARTNRTEQAINYFNLAYKEGNIDEALHRLAHMYSAKESTHSEAERYFKLAIEKGDDYAIVSLARFYFENRIKIDEAEQLIRKVKLSYPTDPYIHEISANIMFSGSKFKEAIDDLAVVLTDEKYVEEELKDITQLLINLLSKDEYKNVLRLFDVVKTRDILKPIYFALMVLMKEEFPNEYLKMGEEISETVYEIVSEIKSKQK